MKTYKYYEYININILPYNMAIVPGTYKERKYSITFCASTTDGEIYSYFIDTFNVSATMQKLSTVSVNNPIGCTADFQDLFKKIEYEEYIKNDIDACNSAYKHILRRFKKGY